MCQVSIDGLHNAPNKNALCKIIYCLNPPAPFYVDPKLTDDVEFTRTHDWESPVKYQKFLDDFHVRGRSVSASALVPRASRACATPVVPRHLVQPSDSPDCGCQGIDNEEGRAPSQLAGMGPCSGVHPSRRKVRDGRAFRGRVPC